MISLESIARALGGQAEGIQVRCPGPGHSSTDRSLSVKLTSAGTDVITHSFCGDDPIRCKDYVREKCGLPSWRPGHGNVETTYEFRDPGTGKVRYRKKRVDRPDGNKTFFIEPKGRGGSEPLLYCGERLAGLGEGQPVWIVEGEKKVAQLREFGAAAVCADAGAKSKWLPSHARLLCGHNIVLWPDSDDAGEVYAESAARAIRAENPYTDIRVVRPFGLPNGTKGRDVCDWKGNAEALAKLIETAEPYAPLNGGGPANGEVGSDDAEISRLAKLRLADYERERNAAAERLGFRATILDKLVAAERPADESAPGNGRPLKLPEPDLWPEPVDGAALVAELTAAIRKYIVLTENDALAASLWVLHAYCFDAFPCTPRLAITAPEKRCGKTTLLDVIALLVPKALPTANISTAATFRTIEAVRPVLLIDEGDAFLKENEELRGILNSGHRAGGQVIRTVGDDFEPRSFSTHCPIAIAQIGKLPDTLADRSIHISMKRRAPGEKVTRLRTGKTPGLVEAASKAVRWVADHADAIRECDPDIPDAIYNRAADNWEPLLAIAEIAGGYVPERARTVALAACGVEEEQSFSTQLLADIRGVFHENTYTRIFSADLIAKLVAVADRPWGECNKGKALTQNGLARHLKKFGIRPETVRIGDEQAKGFKVELFDDAFNRYLPTSQSVPPYHCNKINDLDETRSVPETFDGTDGNSRNSRNFNAGTDGTDENPEFGARARFGTNVTDEKVGSETVRDDWEGRF